MAMGSSLASRKAYALSDDDLERLLPGTPALQYSDLGGKSLEQITDGDGNAVVLFVQEETPTEVVGHWLAVCRQPTGVLLFDPYGSVKPDPWYRNSKELSKAELAETHQTRPVLEGIVRDAGFEPLFNRTGYQTDRKDVNTCGRHCVVRIWNAHLNNADYTAALYAAGDNADTVVTRLTDGVLSGKSRQKYLIEPDT